MALIGLDREPAVQVPVQEILTGPFAGLCAPHRSLLPSVHPWETLFSESDSDSDQNRMGMTGRLAVLLGFSLSTGARGQDTCARQRYCENSPRRPVS